MNDWNPETCARFRGLRLRPTIDLLAQVPDLLPGGVADPGRGAGAAVGIPCACPGVADGFAFFPFRRLFFTVVRPAGATIQMRDMS